MVTDRDYKPHPVPDWSTLLADKQAEIERLMKRIRQLEELLYAQERQTHVDMGR